MAMKATVTLDEDGIRLIGHYYNLKAQHKEGGKPVQMLIRVVDSHLQIFEIKPLSAAAKQFIDTLPR